jgi:mannose-6-phosphate isomerase-like protein (cupin superfamily)
LRPEGEEQQPADRWRTVRNPVIGDEVTFVHTAGETGGEHTLARVLLNPGGGNPLHYHLTYTEEFEVVDGFLTIHRDGERLMLGPGETAHAPIGSRHRFANDTDRPVTFLTTIRPARRFEEQIRIAYGLARDGKTIGGGVPRNPLQLALLFEISETYIPALPLAVQRGIFGPLARLAHWLRSERSLEKYLIEPGTSGRAG